ncbi:Epoxyqueuosine reductase QueG (queuosine biosynthesis) [Desulfocicer vacuolatum DSM 3385]|uniref:Epoxyqueuosine reductase QueG (Queuosine biosynthesis) n=1 Tax=Desulfocicer vacuolatum DSM 3385 TaxID=1121400 RepID=A0A1W2DKP3_9BACT|nr:epoxyqueuosine reductase [Desulfocicer vacuolatum]SMC97997.1 Epoxyqueuosine reductase QueG (queuosine biosynthesis) [Desulfocicer vacuolatum DSM 3385]
MKKEAIHHIEKFVKNHQAKPEITTHWGVPIVGFASADEPLFSQLPSVASPTHAVPRDFLPNAKTVIAYFIPFKKEMTRTNLKKRNSSKEWGLAYIETNEMIRQLSESLKEWFKIQGHEGHTIPATHNWDEKKLISDWSHRHIAYMAGIGNFGLNNMLITEQGCCGRVGSFITSAKIAPDTRYQEETCLYKYDGTCKKCVKECVNEALFVTSFDRFKCYEMLLENVENSRAIGYADVCGKCLVGTPCSHMNPVANKRKTLPRE